MLDSFLTFINRLGLNLRSQRTLLTVSGGVDSVVMVDLFHRAGFQAGIAHCNFGLRGEESVMDEEFVRQLADKYNYPCFVKQFDTKLYAKENGVSTQMAARDLRYTWFEELRNGQFEWIATAHHINDSLETVLLNLARGTGIAGLTGISPENGYVLRPLLFAAKEEILAYANDNHIAWREDRSNSSLDYKRNIIRKKIVPVLKELNPSLETTFRTTFEKINAANSILNHYLEQWKRGLAVNAEGELVILTSKLKEQKEGAYLLWSAIQEYGFSYVQAMQIVGALESVSGLSFYSATHQVLKERDSLIIRKKSEPNHKEPVNIDGPGMYEVGDMQMLLEECDSYAFSRENRNILYLDLESISLPLQMRKWEHGDVFQPFGLNGRKKKISDVLIDLKYTMYEKEKVMVLTDSHGEIMWVVGIRADERWRIGDSAKTFYRLEYKPLTQQG